jgi:hypothetical protein
VHSDRAAVAGESGGAAEPRRGRSLARTLTYAYLAAGVLGVLGEAGARTIDYVRDRIPFSAAPDFNHDLMVRDSFGTRGRPFGQFQKWKLNSAGLRSPESVLTAQPGCVRVMTLGSSETFGSWGEGPGKEYPAQLSDSLRGHGCYQVLNAAVVGMSVRGAIQSFNGWSSGFRPDIVVVIANPTTYLGNRPPEFARVAPVRPKPGPPWWTPRLRSKADELIEFPDFIQHWRVQRQLSEISAGRPRDWEFTSIPPDRLEQYRSDLDSLLTTVRSHGARAVLVAHPVRVGAIVDASDRPLLDALRTFTERAGSGVILAFDSAAANVVRDLGRRTATPVVDLPPVMNGRRELFDDVVHYTDAGAAVVAGEVARTIRGMAAQPDRGPPDRR